MSVACGFSSMLDRWGGDHRCVVWEEAGAALFPPCSPQLVPMLGVLTMTVKVTAFLHTLQL
jgi:hypothetical protein